MKVIQSYSIGKLHELAVDYICKNGYPVTTEEGEETVETEPLCLVTKTPFAANSADEYRISVHSPFTEHYMAEYTSDLINGKKSNFVYDYHSRLFAYNCDDTQKSDVSVNQIEYIIEKLRAQPTSRRAQAITWKPSSDCCETNVPCLQYIQCHIVNNKLDMTVMFRSNDMLLAFGANAYALTELQKFIAESLHCGVGTYTHISLIPHVYYARDADVLRKFLQGGCNV